MILLLALITQILAQDDPSTEIQQFLEIGQTYQGFIHPRQSNHSLFYFIVPEQTNSTDLVIMVKAFNPLADPNVYISRVKTNPLSVQDSDVLACEAKGTDTCVLSKNQVTTGDTLYLAVVSRFPCRFSIRIDQDQELKLFSNDFIILKMNNTQQSKVIQFDLGEIESNIIEIEIVFESLNINTLEETFHAYMNEEVHGVPSNEIYDYIAKDLLNTKVIEIKNIFPNQKYLILIDAPPGAIIQVSTQVNSQIKQLQIYEEKYQVVEQGDYDFYVLEDLQYTFDFNQFNYEIHLTPFQGYASLYVNPNELPPLLQNFAWSEKDKQGESIILTKEDINSLNTEFRSLYIAVYGEEFSTYKLSVLPLYKLDQNISEYISPSVLFYRKIQKNNFLRMQISEYRYKDFNLMIDFKKKIGNYNYIITNCTDWSSDCPPINWDLVNDQQSFEEMPFHIFLYSKTLKLDHVRLFCQGQIICYWQILVYLDEAEDISEGKVALSYHIMEDQILLQENTPHKSFIDIENYNYYKFIIQENDQIHRISFIVTPIMGDVTLYMSTKKKYPNQENCERQSENNSINMGGRFGEAPAPGTYYLSVFGNTTSKYTITVWAIRSFEDFNQLGKFPWHYMQLYSGDPQYHELFENEIALYKIDLQNYDQNYYNSRIQVSLQIDYGEFLIYGFTKPEINIDNYIWKGVQQLSIESNDEQYPQILYLRVQLNNAQNYGYGRYRIVFTFDNEMIWLFQDTQHFSYINAQQYQTFIYELKSNETFIITKSALNYNQTELSWILSDEYNFEMIYSKSRNSVRIKPKDEFLNWIYQQGLHTHYYFSFLINSNSSLFYSIIITSEKQSEIQLFDNQPLTKAVPLIVDNFYLYTNNKEVSIVCNSYFVQTTILAKFVNSHEEPYPTKEAKDYDKVSKRHLFNSQSSIYFKQNELQDRLCNPTCLLKISVYPDDSTYGIDQMMEYTIQYNQDAILLIEGSSQFGQLQKNEIKYYKANVQDSDKNLMILVTPFYFCDVNLYVSKDTYPTQGNYQWSSFDYLGDSLIIEAGNSVSSQISGNYMYFFYIIFRIGVGGDSECQFSIQYSLGKIQFYNIFPNNPQTFRVGQNETIYLKIIPFYAQSLPLTIFFTSYTDMPVMYIDEIDILNDNFDYLKKNITQYKYNNEQKGYTNLFQISEQRLDSTFIIAVTSKQDEDVVIQANYAEEIMYLQRDLLYKYYIQENKNVTFQLGTEYQQQITLWILIKKGDIKSQYRLTDYYSTTNNSFTELVIDKNMYLNRYDIKTENQLVQLNILGQKETIFSLNFIIGDGSLKPIYSFHPDYFYLRSRDTFSYSYVSSFYQDQEEFKNPEQKTFSITIGLITGYMQIDGKYKKNLPDVIVKAKNKDFKLMPLIYQTLDNVLYMEYIEFDTEYSISISSNSQIDQNCFIQISSNEVRPLIPKLRFMQSEKLQESTYWQISEQLFYGNIFYDFQFCGGLFEVLLSSDLEKLKNGQYDQQIQTNSNRKIQGIIQIDSFYSESLFIKIRPYKIFEQEEQASYTLKINNYNNLESIPYENIHPGDYGALTHTLEQIDGKIKLTVNFTQLNYSFDQTESDFSIDQVEYYLLVQERSEFDEELFNYCVDPKLQAKIIQLASNKSQDLSITTELQHLKNEKTKNLAITVLAKAYLNSDFEHLSLDYNYESKHIRWNSDTWKKSKSYRRYIIGSIIILTVVGIAMLISFIKRRQGQQYEVRDNQTSLQQGIELNYRGLTD